MVEKKLTYYVSWLLNNFLWSQFKSLFVIGIVQKGWAGLPGDAEKNRKDVEVEARASMRAVLNYEFKRSQKAAKNSK